MRNLIEEHAKRLKLSWIREHYHEVEASTHEEFLLKLFEQEIQQREKRKLDLLIRQSSLPDISGRQFDWNGIHLNSELSREDVLAGGFIERKENLILYGGVGVGKTLLASLCGWNAIHQAQRRVRFYTVAQLVNQLLEAHDKGTLGKLYKQIESLDLLILDELGYVPLHKQGAELLFQVLNLCYEQRSVIVTTNLQFGQWMWTKPQLRYSFAQTVNRLKARRIIGCSKQFPAKVLSWCSSKVHCRVPVPYWNPSCKVSGERSSVMDILLTVICRTFNSPTVGHMSVDTG